MGDSIGVRFLNNTLRCGASGKGNSVYGSHGEIAMSENALKAKVNIAVTDTFWRGHNFLDQRKTAARCSDFETARHGLFPNDPWFPPFRVTNDFMLTESDIEDIVFYKTNRRSWFPIHQKIAFHRLCRMTAT